MSYIKYFALYYQLDDRGNWTLTDFEHEQRENWSTAPLSGVKEESIKGSLVGQRIMIDDEEWRITQENTTSISIDGHDTNLEEQTDMVTVSLVLDADVEEAKGQLTISYKFNDGWEIESVSGGEVFTATVKPEVALNVTDEDLIAEIAKQEIKFGESQIGILVNYASQQTVSINESEISDFVIESQDSSSKGSQQIFYCSGTLTKSHATFNLHVIIQYNYNSADDWVMQSITIAPQVTSVNIVGDWTGTYNGTPYSGEATLSISNITDDGLITAVYSFTPPSSSIHTAGSYNVSGNIDMSTLHIELVAGDWVVEPSQHLSITKVDISAYLLVEDSTIQGLGQEGNVFIVKHSPS